MDSTTAVPVGQTGLFGHARGTLPPAKLLFGATFTPSRGIRRSPARHLRKLAMREAGLTGGRQWVRLRKALRRHLRAQKRAAREG